jgi:hypothetical protein
MKYLLSREVIWNHSDTNELDPDKTKVCTILAKIGNTKGGDRDAVASIFYLKLGQ